MSLNRIGVVIALLIVAAAGWFLILKPGAASDDRPVLRVASQKGGAKSLLTAAGALDGAPYRIEWSEFPAAQPLLEALAAGAVDIGATADSPFIFAYSGGARIKAVQASRSAGGGASTAIIVRGDSPLQKPSDLRGKKIATGRASVGHYLLLRLLERENIPLSEVSVVYLAPGDAKAAFSSGDLDAWATWNPYVGAAVLHDGARILVDGQGILTGIGFQVASDGAIAAKRPELTDFLNRLRTASAWARANTGPYSQILAKETGLPLDVATYMVERSRAVPAAIDDSVIAEEKQTLETLTRAGLIEKTPDLTGAFDASFDTQSVAAD